MRFLLVSHVPIVRELGAGRIQLETAEELRRLGHTVETFDVRDAFPDEAVRRRDRFRPLRFAVKARDHVSRVGSQFDVVDALPGTLPYSKAELHFNGLLVARSTGLYPFYHAFSQVERERWPDQVPGTFLGQAVARWASDRSLRATLRSLANADLVRVLNDEERVYVEARFGDSATILQLPDGLPDLTLDALRAAALPPQERLRRKEVVFVGAWGLRKGAGDWRSIVLTLRSLVPDVRFRFLGTGVSSTAVQETLDLPAADWVTVIPSYAAEDLPALLSSSTVGAFPSYVEGWPIGLLEKLAAGIPTVAYGAPGARTMLENSSLLVALGDAEGLARRVAELLTSDAASYATLGRACVDRASSLRLSLLVPRLLDAYASQPAAQT